MRFSSQPGSARYRRRCGPVAGRIARIVFCVTLDGSQAAGKTLAAIAGAAIHVGAAGGGNAATLRFAPALAGASEAGDDLRRALSPQRGMEVPRAVGQGFNGGLSPLARSFGIDVADEPPAALPPPPAAARRLPRAPGQSEQGQPGQAGPGRSSSKSAARASARSRSISTGRAGARALFGSGTAIDPRSRLPAGAEQRRQGRRPGARPQFRAIITSRPISRCRATTGRAMLRPAKPCGSTARSGARSARVAIFANIYDGVPNWAQTDGVVTVTMPDQPPIEVRMTDGRDNMRLCGVVLLENDGGSLKATRIVDYFRRPARTRISLRLGHAMGGGPENNHKKPGAAIGGHADDHETITRVRWSSRSSAWRSPPGWAGA